MGKKWWLLFIAAALLLVFITSRVLKTNEPSYRGRSLTEWIGRLPAPGSNSRGVTWAPLVQGRLNDKELEATDAVRQIGTNALPYLLAEIQTDKKSFKEEIQNKWVRLRVFFQKLISRSNPPRVFNSSNNWEKTAAQRRHWNAARGFYALGPLAKAAIPDLTRILYQGDECPDAVYALSGIGPEGLTLLMQALPNNSPTNQWTRICVIWALGQNPANGGKALPELLGFLKCPDETLRMSAAWSLGQIHSEPEIIVPALADNLGDTNLNVKNMTEQALAEHGIKALTVSALKDYLVDPKPYVRMAATNAIRARYPAEAVKLGLE